MIYLRYVAFSLCLIVMVQKSYAAFIDDVKACDKQIGVSVPEFTCDTLVTAANQHAIKSSFVKGQEKDSSGDCNTPAMLRNSCDPGSTVGVLYNSPDVQISASCRTSPSGSGYNDIAVIQYNRNNGASCFYQALGSMQSADVRRPVLGNSTSQGGWDRWFLGGAGCVRCHDNGPFIRSPYMAAATDPLHVLPGTKVSHYYTDNSPYWNVFAPQNTTYSIKAKNNTCLNCHRLSAYLDGSVLDSGGTSGHYALTASADNYNNPSSGTNIFSYTFNNQSVSYIPWDYSTIVNKRPHGPESPIWMIGTTYSQANFESAAKIDFCRKFGLESNRPDFCLPAQKHPRITDSPAQGKFGSETVWALSNNVPDPQASVAGDFNGDGLDDLVWKDFSNIMLALNLGKGQFNMNALPLVTWDLTGSQLFAEDFNGDGLEDLAIKGFTPTNSWFIRYNLGNGSFSNPITIAWPVSATAALLFTTGDFNGDRLGDLVMLDRSTRVITIRYGSVNGSFSNQTTFNLSNTGISGHSTTLKAGDINGDGYDDLAVNMGASGETHYTLINQYDRRQLNTSLLGQFGSPVDAGVPNWTNIKMGDFNGDKLADLGTMEFALAGINSYRFIIRYALKGVIPRALKTKSGFCLHTEALAPISQTTDIFLFDAPKLSTKTCSGTDKNQKFFLGNVTNDIVQLTSVTNEMAIILVSANSLPVQVSLRTFPFIPTEAHEWKVIYKAGEMKFFQLQSRAFPDKCLSRKSDNTVDVKICSSTDNDQLWSH
jgi:hypothetical protein